MWITIISWIAGIFGISAWIFSLSYLEKETIFAWIDNKFGPDDPMPPMPTSNPTPPTDDKK